MKLSSRNTSGKRMEKEGEGCVCVLRGRKYWMCNKGEKSVYTWMYVCQCVCVCVCFLRPSRGGKFSWAIIRPQITALHSQKSPLLGPHQLHNEDFAPKHQNSLEKCRNLNLSRNTEELHYKQLFCGKISQWWTKKGSRRQWHFTRYSWNTLSFTFSPVITTASQVC